jgi:hypothetical protein
MDSKKIKAASAAAAAESTGSKQAAAGEPWALHVSELTATTTTGMYSAVVISGDCCQQAVECSDRDLTCALPAWVLQERLGRLTSVFQGQQRAR